MKIINQTPFVDEKGELGFSQRIQGMLQFGMNWPAELQAQQTISDYFERNLEKGYTLIRNQALGQSGIMIPMILIGTAGVFAINITHLRGRYEAKGDQWNIDSGSQLKPARENLIQKTATMARALTAFIERQGATLPAPIQPVLIAAEPGLQIDSNQSIVKVLMSDAIRTFVAGLKSGAPVLRAEATLDFVERITNPRPARVKHAPMPTSSPAVAPRPSQPTPPQPQPAVQNVSKARAIFNATDEAKPLNPNDFDFALAEDESAAREAMKKSGEPASPLEKKRVSRRILGMTLAQIIFLAALGIILICILAAFGYILFGMS